MWRYALPVSAGEAVGVAAVDFQSESEPDTSALPALTAPLRGSLAGALGMYISHQELTTARMLIDSARDLSRMLDPREVLAAALARAMELSEAQTGSIMLVDAASGRLHIALSKGLSEEVVQSTSLSEGEGIAGWVLASRQPLLIEDLAARTPSARRHGVRSAVSVPIADDDGILGVLNVGSRSFPARFTESHMGSMELLGKQTAIALRNARAVVESRALYFDTLKALAVALETKDPYSRGGTERVLEYAEALGASFGLPDHERDALRIAALLHDIGMAAAGEGVVLADRPLTTVERALLKMHPQIASEILDEAPALHNVVPIVYHHHEWYDGEGYLNGVSGEGIPLGARILAVADAYVAMTSDRPYRRAFSEREAMRELTEKAGTQFDPSVVDALRDILQGGPNRVPGSSGGNT
jgi:HD-GYP domain-containing protein (c-di-GMP phosphodiesterase class II)